MTFSCPDQQHLAKGHCLQSHEIDDFTHISDQVQDSRSRQWMSLVRVSFKGQKQSWGINIISKCIVLLHYIV